MEIEEGSKKRKRDDTNSPEKQPRSTPPEEYDEWQAQFALFLQYRKQALEQQGLEDDTAELEMVMSDDLAQSAEDQANKPKDNAPLPLEPLSPQKNASVLEGFEEWYLKNTGKLILYEADDSWEKEQIELTDEELSSLKTDKHEIIFAPLSLAGSVLRGDEGTTNNNSTDKPLKLRFHFLDIGQGNGTLVECPHGELILIDFGTAKNSGVTVGPAIEAIKRIGSKLDYLIVSHADKDHVNQLPKLADLTFGKVYCGGKEGDYDKTDGQKLVALLKTKGMELTDCLLNGGDAYSEAPDSKPEERKIQCKDVDIFIAIANAPSATRDQIRSLRPDSEKNNPETQPGTDTNAASIVVCFRYGGKQVMISADATFDTDYYLLNSELCKKWKGELKCYAASGGHHGAKFSFSEALLDALDPEWMHFSADLQNGFKHPNWVLLDRILKRCKNLTKSPAYGPHGVVIGEVDDDEPASLERLDDEIKTLAELKAKLAKEFPKRIIGWKETLVWECCRFIRSFKMGLDSNSNPAYPASPWFKEVTTEVAKKLFTLAPKTEDDLLNIALMDEMENLNYWAVRFESLGDEQSRLKEEDYDTIWSWFTTEANLFTAMETADLGVYWVLEIEPDGKTLTFRT